MAKSKYSIVKGKTGKTKKVVVEGVKKALYKKLGSMTMYVLTKGRHMKLSKYKKMKTNTKNSPVKKRRVKKRGGGDMMEMMDILSENNQDGGARKRRKRKRKPKK